MVLSSREVERNYLLSLDGSCSSPSSKIDAASSEKQKEQLADTASSVVNAREVDKVKSLITYEEDKEQQADAGDKLGGQAKAGKKEGNKSNSSINTHGLLEDEKESSVAPFNTTKNDISLVDR
ncbi:unnamed protein product [Amoebophrya sp. A25]|nr:unnamed protein product [Amoebophrya sp. A25]|eukprot:GSA25T00004792001.1